MIYNDKNLEEVGARKCPKCGSTMNKQITRNGAIWTCNRCDYSDMDRIGKDFTAEYKTARRCVSDDIERAIDSPYEPIRCSCRNHTPIKKLKVRSTLSNGIEYICPKCGAVQIDNNIKKSLDLLYQLKKDYPDESEYDPVLQYLFIKIFSYNFQKWNDRIPGLIDRLSETAADKKDLSDIEKYKRSLSTLQIQYAIDQGIFKLCPKCKSNYIHRDAKVCEDCSTKVKEKKAKNKKGAKIFLITFSVILLLACIAFVLFLYYPQWFFGVSTIEYYIDGEKYETDCVFSRQFWISPPEKEGYRFLGLYDAEIDGNQIVNEDGQSLTYSTYIEDTITLYPHWETIIYNIILDAGDYIIKDDLSTITVETTYGELEGFIPPAKMDDYEFLGWFTEDGVQVTDKNGNFIIEWLYTEETIILRAKYVKIKTVAMVYDLNDTFLRVPVEGLINEYGTAENGFDYVLDVPASNKYYKFIGWFAEDGKQLTDENGVSIGVLVEETDAESIKVCAYWDNADAYAGYTYISTTEEFTKINDNLSGKYLLMNDIDLGGIAQWQPFGGYYLNEGFSGVLDGQNYKILNLKRSDRINVVNDYSYYGLFGYIKSGGVVMNLVFENVLIGIASGEADNDVRAFHGVVAGKCSGKIANVVVNGTLAFSKYIKGEAHFGGICGIASMAEIFNCINNINIYCDRYASAVGGIAAYARGGSISDCINNGILTAIGTDKNGFAICGAIVAQIYKNDQPKFTNVNNFGSFTAKPHDTKSWFTSCDCYTGMSFGRTVSEYY